MRCALIVLSVLTVCAQGADKKEPGLKERLVEHLNFLASDDMAGRKAGSAENKKAVAYIEERFKKYELAPLFENGYRQDFTDVYKNNCTNVGGIIKCKEKSDDYILICGHHDGLGKKKETVYNGANDNASGVAAVLEMARLFTSRIDELKCNVILISFDSEENGLLGSYYFVDHSPVEIEKIKIMLCTDVVGGDLLKSSTEKKTIYLLGLEYSEGFEALTSGIKTDLILMQIGLWVIELFGFPRSDYAGFRSKKVPFIFFSSGTDKTYHTPEDDVENMNPEKLAKVTEYMCELTMQLTTKWNKVSFREKKDDPTFKDAEAMIGHVTAVMKDEDCPFSDEDRKYFEKAIENLKKAVEDQNKKKCKDIITMVSMRLLGR